MNKNVAILFCLLVYWNVCCHGEEGGEGGNAKSMENEGLSCKDVNPDPAIMKRDISVFTVKEISTGDWVTTFQADRDLDNSTAAVNLKIRQELVSCGEDKRMVLRITGVMRDIDGESFISKLHNVTIPEIKEEEKDISVNVDKNTRSIESPTRDDIAFINKTLGDNIITARNSSNAIAAIEDRLSSLEKRQRSLENTLKSLEGAINQIRDTLVKIPRYGGEALRFHSGFKGENILITNDGTTASRIELSKTNAAVVTERPLRDDEIFSVRIDKSDESINKRKGSSPVLGLILNPTADITTTYYFCGKVGAWCLSWGDVYNQTFGAKRYSFRLDDIPDGTVLGVTRKKNGDVHFFKDGVDMGLAFERVPYRVYGIFEVIHYVTQISLVNQNP